MHFHGVFPGNQHEMWSKPHNGKVSQLAYVAATLGIKAMDAAREGRFTEAQSLFASSLTTYEHRETINAFVLFMEDLGRSDIIEERFKNIRQTEDPTEIAATFATLGNYYARHGDLGKASGYYARAHAIIDGQTVVEFYSCFLSHSDKDRLFVQKLYTDLQAKGVRCWYAPEDLKIGERIRSKIDDSIRIYDKLILILSKNSSASLWVEQEVETALDRERQTGHTVLFPIRIDNSVMELRQGWPALLRNTRNIGDFRRWKNSDAYQRALERLLRDLKAAQS